MTTTPPARALVTSAPFYTRADDLVFLDDLHIGDTVFVLTDPDAGGAVTVWIPRTEHLTRVDDGCLYPIPPDAGPRPSALDSIDRETAAHVLYHYNGTGYSGGSFTRALIAVMARADADHLARLSLAFPGYAYAVALARNTPRGSDVLASILRGTPPRDLETFL